MTYFESLLATQIEGLILIVPYFIFKSIIFLVTLPLYFVLREYHKVIKANITVAFPQQYGQKESQENAPAIKKVLKNLLQKNFFTSILNIAEVARFLNFHKTTLQQYSKVHGLEHIESAYQKGKGVILFSAHYGNFIYPMLYLSLVKKMKVNFIIRKLDNPFIGLITYNSFAEKGITTIIRGTSAINATLDALKRGEIVYLLMDQNVAIGGIFVPFFARPASTFRGIYQFQKKTGCEVVGCNDYRQKGLHHELTFYPAIKKQRNEHKLIEKVNQQIEAFITRDPIQHLWIHPRWKRQPEGVENPYQEVKNLAAK